MRIANGLGLLALCFLMSGCAVVHWFHHKPPPPQPAPAASQQPPPIVVQQTPPAVNRPSPAKVKQPPPAQPAPAIQPVIKADLRSWGNVVKVNAGARFVIVSFEAGTVPPAGQRFNVYRAGAKVGQVTITGPQQENNTVADIVSGDIPLHDEVRAD